jgi:hypothetical protein
MLDWAYCECIMWQTYRDRLRCREQPARQAGTNGAPDTFSPAVVAANLVGALFVAA